MSGQPRAQAMSAPAMSAPAGTWFRAASPHSAQAWPPPAEAGVESRLLMSSEWHGESTPSWALGPTSSDEALAWQLQAEEWKCDSDLFFPPERLQRPPKSEAELNFESVPENEPSAPVAVAEEDMAAIAQLEAEEARLEAQRLVAVYSDEQMARELRDREEWEEARQEAVEQLTCLLRRFSEMWRYFVAWVPRSAPTMPRSEDCTPHATAFLASGAFCGCASGLQVAAILGLGTCASAVCAVGGAAAGHAAVGPSGRRRFRGQEREVEEPIVDPTYREYGGSVERGLSPSSVEAYTVEHTYDASPADDALGEDEACKCMVCIEPFSSGDQLRTLPCLHRYHSQCIDEWLTRSKECPICKWDVTVQARFPDAGPGPSPSSGTRIMRWLRPGRASR